MENMLYFEDFVFSYDPDIGEIKSYDYKTIAGYKVIANEGILISINSNLAQRLEEYFKISLESIGIEVLEDTIDIK